MAFRNSVFLYLSFLLLVFFASAKVEVVLRLDEGSIKGVTRTVKMADPSNNYKIDAFLGIPYGEPPVGEHRFAKPVRKNAWSHVWDCTKKPHSCPNPPDLTYMVNGKVWEGAGVWNTPTPQDEDCLYLNVYRPSGITPNAKLAVLVWIFGGGFTNGGSTLDLYDGDILAGSENIILVSMNYRVSSLGFAYLNDKEISGNMGLYDQLLALQWVQKNINKFGGDPKNVTIFGESAGAASVNFLLFSPLAKGLFHAAMMQSSAAACPWALIGKKNARNRTLALARLKNCSRPTDYEIAACLKKLPVSWVSDGEEYAVVSGHAQFPFVPIIDGKFVTDSPRQMLKEMRWKRSSLPNIPIMNGFNRDEGTFFLLYFLAFTTHQQLLNLTFLLDHPNFGLSFNSLWTDLENTMKYYPHYPWTLFGHDNTNKLKSLLLYHYLNWKNPENESANLLHLQRAAGDFNFLCDTLDLADTYAKSHRKAFTYYFTQQSSVQKWPKWGGVMHGDEIFFFFGQPFRANQRKDPYTASEKALSKMMMRKLANFARSRDPNIQYPGASPDEGIPWPRHTLPTFPIRVLNAAEFESPPRSDEDVKDFTKWGEKEALGAEGDALIIQRAFKERCNFWRAMSFLFRKRLQHRKG